MEILVTGGAGYIGSHTCVDLLEAGHRVVVADNFSNSNPESLERVGSICSVKPVLETLDLCDFDDLSDCFSRYSFDAVIHFAGLKSVGESIVDPLLYYRNNLDSSLNLCRAMQQHGVEKLIFSSSATVYGVPEKMPVDESFPTSVTNPYGSTKLMIETMLQDWVSASTREGDARDSGFCPRVALLRYFNPVGAHKSGLIGESPSGIPNNLVPYIAQVASGKLEKLKVYGNDYPTRDGTGVRDFIHVCDLSYGHVKALEWLSAMPDREPVCEIFNLGTGVGYTVLELLDCFCRVSGIDIPFDIVGRREGDVAVSYADASKAAKVLGWKAERALPEMMEDTWRWQQNNPEGFVS